MLVFINSVSKDIPENCNTVSKLLDYLHIKRQGSGVGINNKLIMAKDWDTKEIKPEDRITVISAAYGG